MRFSLYTTSEVANHFFFFLYFSEQMHTQIPSVDRISGDAYAWALLGRVNATSLTFGGPNMNDLYVTTKAQESTDSGALLQSVGLASKGTPDVPANIFQNVNFSRA